MIATMMRTTITVIRIIACIVILSAIILFRYICVVLSPVWIVVEHTGPIIIIVSAVGLLVPIRTSDFCIISSLQTLPQLSVNRLINVNWSGGGKGDYDFIAVHNAPSRPPLPPIWRQSVRHPSLCDQNSMEDFHLRPNYLWGGNF